MMECAACGGSGSFEQAATLSFSCRSIECRRCKGTGSYAIKEGPALLALPKRVTFSSQCHLPSLLKHFVCRGGKRYAVTGMRVILNRKEIEFDLSDFICPITGDLMSDPVMDRQGHTYERRAIEQWLERSCNSPMTRYPLSKADLKSNEPLRKAIKKYQEKSLGERTEQSTLSGKDQDKLTMNSLEQDEEGSSNYLLHMIIVNFADSSMLSSFLTTESCELIEGSPFEMILAEPVVGLHSFSVLIIAESEHFYFIQAYPPNNMTSEDNNLFRKMALALQTKGLGFPRDIKSITLQIRSVYRVEQPGWDRSVVDFVFDDESVFEQAELTQSSSYTRCLNRFPAPEKPPPQAKPPPAPSKVQASLPPAPFKPKPEPAPKQKPKNLFRQFPGTVADVKDHYSIVKVDVGDGSSSSAYVPSKKADPKQLRKGLEVILIEQWNEPKGEWVVAYLRLTDGSRVESQTPQKQKVVQHQPETHNLWVLFISDVEVRRRT
mmetsp:Transcript_12236/g.28239  ORF Transcript_12236/g.28239 Transcript_12236/m.28239 type:complete len:491 (-) Transcript_12236:106-1578(-)